MAIFVLLMIVFLTMVNQSDIHKVEMLEKELKEKTLELTKSIAERDSSREQTQELVQQITQLEQAVRAKGLQLVIAVDTTGSMSKPLGHLVETINTIAKVLPKITPDLSIGIVAYRQGENEQRSTHEFSLRRVYPPEKDGGRSLKELSDFMNGLKAEGGLAPVEIAVDTSLKMFSQSGQSQGVQAFMLLGDVGPYEDSGEVPAIFFESLASESENEHRIIDKLKRWSQGSSRRKVISVFSGTKPEASADYYDQTLATHEASRAFFSRIASDVGQADNFTDNPAKMLVYLLNAIIER
jgi:hypothetical protein